jgi:hypothetical protein
MLIEVGVAVKYNGKKKTHKWCEDENELYGQNNLGHNYCCPDPIFYVGVVIAI